MNGNVHKIFSQPAKKIVEVVLKLTFFIMEKPKQAVLLDAFYENISYFNCSSFVFKRYSVVIKDASHIGCIMKSFQQKKSQKQRQVFDPNPQKDPFCGFL